MLEHSKITHKLYCLGFMLATEGRNWVLQTSKTTLKHRDRELTGKGLEARVIALPVLILKHIHIGWDELTLHEPHN